MRFTRPIRGGSSVPHVSTARSRRRSRLLWASGILAAACSSGLWLFAVDAPAQRLASADDDIGIFAEVRILRKKPYCLHQLEPDESDDEFDRWRQMQAKVVKSPSLLRTVLNEPQVATVVPGETVEKQEGWLRRALQIEFTGHETMRISTRGLDGPTAARVINAVTNAYLRVAGEHERQWLHRRLEKLERVCHRCEDQLRNSVLQVRNLRERAAPSDQISSGDRRTTGRLIGELRSRIVDVSIRLQVARAELAYLDANDPAHEATSKAEIARTVRQLEAEHTACKHELAQLRQQAKIHSSVDVITLEDDIRRQRQLYNRISKEIEKCRIEAHHAESRITLLRPATVPEPAEEL